MNEQARVAPQPIQISMMPRANREEVYARSLPDGLAKVSVVIQ